MLIKDTPQMDISREVCRYVVMWPGFLKHESRANGLAICTRYCEVRILFENDGISLIPSRLVGFGGRKEVHCKEENEIMFKPDDSLRDLAKTTISAVLQMEG